MGTAKAQIAVPQTERSDAIVDPIPAYAFYVEIDQIVEASFLGCSGLSMRREQPEIIKEGGLNNEVHVLPPRITYGQITLRHGITYSDALLQWFLEGAEDGKVSKRKVTIFQVVPYVTGKVVRRYTLENAIPVSWTGPGLETTSTEIAVETLELAFSKLTLDSQGG